VATTATITSSDSVYAVATQISQDPIKGTYVVDLNISTAVASQDIIDVRVNGIGVWQGLATEATG
jgi:hypothetical protein